MIALIQRVSQASVRVSGQQLSQIEQGLLILLGVTKADTNTDVQRLAKRVASYRVFADTDDKMNLSLQDIAGSALVVSQFTLAADTGKGRRPSFSSAAPPAQAEPLYLAFVAALQQQGVAVKTGEFGADMAVSLVNDGPVTFVLES